MKKSILWFVSLWLFTAGAEVWAQAGGQAGAFLRRGYGPRALAMGHAATAVANDASAMFWNPAGLGFISESQLFVSHSFLTFDRRQTFGALLATFPSHFALGVGILNFGVQNIEGRDPSGIATGTFSSNEFGGMFSLSQRIGPVALGVTGKVLYHMLESRSALGYSGDAGVLLHMAFLRIGIVVQDVHSQLMWDTESERMEEIPMTLRFGGALDLQSVGVLLSVEGMKVTGEEEIVVRAGGELRPVRFFGVRGGYTGRHPTLGAFLRLPALGRFDYAATRDDLGDTVNHHLALVIDL